MVATKNKLSELVARIEARFQELGIDKIKLAKRLGVTDAAVSHVFAGRTKMSVQFEKAALDIIEEKMNQDAEMAARRELLLTSDDHQE